MQRNDEAEQRINECLMEHPSDPAEEFDQKFKEAMASQLGISEGRFLTLSQRVPCEPEVANNINDLKSTLASLFGLSIAHTHPILLITEFNQSLVCISCRPHTRFCDLASGMTKQLHNNGLLEVIDGTLGELPTVTYAVREFRVVDTGGLPRIRHVIWLRASCAALLDAMELVTTPPDELKERALYDPSDATPPTSSPRKPFFF